MNTNSVSEADLPAEVESLRVRFSHTQTLYREVAALLFFRYGITPTANKLYQLVRKGSMSAPAEALQTFWQDLREKSRVRLDVADVPPELQSLTGELLGRIWTEALAQAQSSLQVHKDEAQAQVLAAQAEARQAEAELAELQKIHAQVREQLDQRSEHVQSLREELAGLRQAQQEAQRRHAALELENTELQQELRRQGEQFTQDLAQLQKAMALSEERAQAGERRALLEIEKERALQARLQHKLEQQEQELRNTHADHVGKMQDLQHELQQARQELGREQGERRAQQAALDFSHGLAREMQTELQLTRTRIALLERERDDLHEHIQALRAKLEQWQAERPAPVRLKRRPISSVRTAGGPDGN